LQSFTLHGLWPQHSAGGYPQNCPSVLGAPLIRARAMACEWPSFLGLNLDFWRHEWLKHGRCAVPVLGRTYFLQALEAHWRLDIDAALAGGGLGPVAGSNATLPASLLVSAIQRAHGAKPLLSCSRGGQKLAEVWQCLSLELEPVDCPSTVRPPACRERVQLPPGAPKLCGRSSSAVATS
jgi:ribonuclease T2